MPSLNLSLFLQTNNLSEIMADAEIGKNDILVKEELIGLGQEKIKELKEDLENQLNEWEKIPVKIGIIGQSGSGKHL